MIQKNKQTNEEKKINTIVINIIVVSIRLHYYDPDENENENKTKKIQFSTIVWFIHYGFSFSFFFGLFHLFILFPPLFQFYSITKHTPKVMHEMFSFAETKKKLRLPTRIQCIWCKLNYEVSRFLIFFARLAWIFDPK